MGTAASDVQNPSENPFGRRIALMRHPSASKLAALTIALAGAAIAYRALLGPADRRSREVTYPPVDVLKPIAEDLWMVDSGPISASGLKLPVRMAVVRLSNGDLLLHSPTRFVPALAGKIEKLGTVRHLVAPTTAHWSFLKAWQQAFPNATSWGVPGLRERAQVRRAGVRIDRDLGPEAPSDWADDVVQGLVAGGASFQEAYFFVKASRTLLLADLIENLEPGRLPPVTRWTMWAAGATRATTARHVRGVLRLGGDGAHASIRAMVALAPDRVLFAHGRPFEEDGANRLRDAFAWIE